MNDLTIYRELEQRSPEWYAARAGLVTASAIGTLISHGRPDPATLACTDCSAPTGEPCIGVKGNPIKTMHPARHAAADAAPKVLTIADTDTARGLLTTLAAERITGHVEETPFTRDMERGVMAEPFAEDAYIERTGNTVEHVGFMVRSFGSAFRIGYSPDGLVDDDGLTEWKAPRAKGHINTVLADEVPAHYMAQCQAALLVTGREWIDFVSFHGGLPLFIKRVTPDVQWHAAIYAAALAAERTITAITDRYTAATDGLPPTERIPDPFAEIQV